MTVGFEKRALVVVHTVTAWNRLADILSVFDSDLRVQLVFTFPDVSKVSGDVERQLADSGALTISWEQALSEKFDVAISVHHSGKLQTIAAPLAVLSHGIGYSKIAPNPESRIPNPESRIPNPESRIPNPESRIPNPASAPTDWRGNGWCARGGCRMRWCSPTRTSGRAWPGRRRRHCRMRWSSGIPASIGCGSAGMSGRSIGRRSERGRAAEWSRCRRPGVPARCCGVIPI
ncbi:hypothetical protein D5S18_15495 [Nocardia panacis]|uniref:Uncharacterized protein n=1 Tax=Nocardia panacis TaxID=2340916 RepID=A0A3A4JWE6_9NOCA|nr:hypothetical protein D5S18_15495 [Nocardia panacis]